MFVALLEIELRLEASHSLKDKRQVVQSLIDQMRRRFNVSVAEVDRLDAWQSAVIGVACVANEKRFLQEAIAHVENFVESDPRIVVVRTETEIV
ncbi:MAG TPA: DUF503 domain-containing protein [Armatimonadota bacterium]|jgi:hypothetical protein